MRRLVAILAAVAALGTAFAPGAASAALKSTKLGVGIEVQALAAGAKGDLWAAGVDRASDPPQIFVGYLEQSGALKAYVEPAPAEADGVGELIRGPEGLMWFTIPEADRIVRVTAAGNWQTLTMPTGSRPTGLVAAQGDVWATLEGIPEIAQIEPAGPHVTEWDLRPGTALTHVVLGSDNALWSLAAGSGAVVRTNLQGGFAYVPLESGDPARFAGTVNSDIASGDDGSIWVSQRDRATVGKIVSTPGNADYTRYSVPGGPTTYLSPGPGGDIWFADAAGKIGSIAPDGEAGELACALAGCGAVTALARGPEGKLWFAGGSTIGRFEPRPLALTIKNANGRARSDGILLRIRCRGGAGGDFCRGGFELLYRGRRIERSRYRAPTGSLNEVNLPLGGSARRLLAAQGTLPVRLVARVAGKETDSREFALSTAR
jgi:streptogramin lyase